MAPPRQATAGSLNRERMNPMPSIEVQHAAAPGEVFAPDAFAEDVGQRIPFKVGDHEIDGGCEVLAVAVAADGRSVTLTLDLPAEAVAAIGSNFLSQLSVDRQP